MRRCLALQQEAPERGRLARAMGRSPLHPDAVAWYLDALAELETGRRLAALGAGYTVLHSLPIGDADDRDADDRDDDERDAGSLRIAVDHLVIGPSGVFCLASTHSSTVTGEQLDAVAAQARQVSTNLSRALQRVVPVTPLVVTTGAAAGAGAGTGAGPAPRTVPRQTSVPAADVELVESRVLAAWFAKRGPVLTTAELATVALAAEQPSAWNVPVDVLEETTVMNDFSELTSEVDAASDRERVALTVATATAVIVMLVSAAVIVSATSGLLQLAGH